MQVCGRCAVLLAEQETVEQKDLAESQPATMPDYAAGLLAPTFNVSVSISYCNSFKKHVMHVRHGVWCSQVSICLSQVGCSGRWLSGLS